MTTGDRVRHLHDASVRGTVRYIAPAATTVTVIWDDRHVITYRPEHLRLLKEDR